MKNKEKETIRSKEEIIEFAFSINDPIAQLFGNWDFRDFFKKKLEGFGFSSEILYDWKHTISEFNKTEFSLFISDGGYMRSFPNELIAIRKIQPNIPIIMISALKYSEEYVKDFGLFENLLLLSFDCLSLANTVVNLLNEATLLNSGIEND